jgi:hypothetical protein
MFSRFIALPPNITIGFRLFNLLAKFKAKRQNSRAALIASYYPKQSLWSQNGG